MSIGLLIEENEFYKALGLTQKYEILWGLARGYRNEKSFVINKSIG